MTIQHADIQSENAHEPKHITGATTSDHGKVITPSASTDGESVLVSPDSDEVVYDNADSDLAATDVKAALDELDTDIDSVESADGVSYDPSSNNLTATDVQAAIDEVMATRLEAYGSNTVTANSTSISLSDAGDDTFQTAGDFTEITGIWDDPQVEPFDRVTVSTSGDRLVVPITGVYELNFWATSEFSVTNGVVGYNFGINGTVSTERPVAQRFSTSGEKYGVSAHGFLDVNEDDDISIHAAATDAGDLTVVNARVSLRLVERT